jgi:hypothetical protein
MSASYAQTVNILPRFVRAKTFHDGDLLPGHLARVKKFLESKDPMDLYPSAPGSEKKLKSNFGDLNHADHQNQPSFFLTTIDSPAVETGAVAGRVMGDLPARLAALAICDRVARLSTPAEVADWFEAGKQRKAEADAAARLKADQRAGRAQELESLRERAELLERIQRAEAAIEKKAGGK